MLASARVSVRHPMCSPMIPTRLHALRAATARMRLPAAALCLLLGLLWSCLAMPALAMAPGGAASASVSVQAAASAERAPPPHSAASPVQAAAADGIALRGEWLSLTAPSRDMPATAPRQAFDPAQLRSFGRAAGGTWVLLHPRAGTWPAGRWVLSVDAGALQRISLHLPGAAPVRAHLLDSGHGRRAAFGRLAFDLPALPRDGAPLRLHVDASGSVPSTMSFAVRSEAAQLRLETRWLAFATACLATMLATAVFALFFGLRLRDSAFAWYAVYVATYAMIQATQSGYIVQPLGWDALAGTMPVWGRAVTTLSVIAAVLFLDRFAGLHERLPRTRRLLHAYCGLMLLLVSIGYVPALQAFARSLINPLLILGGPLVLGTAIAATWRGSRYAAIFLLGWVPLLGVTVLGSLQLYGVAPTWMWTDDAALAVGAFEAIVLSLGLAERAASVRRQRDQARLLAGTDALTGVLNRRAWRDRLHAHMRDGTHSLSVLYLDLDHFKRVNDRLGHAGGDRVLQLFVDVLRTAVRGPDVIGRYGGEEFVVGLVATGADEARLIAERIRANLQLRSNGMDAPLTVSIGAATHREGEALDDLLRRADAALYAAKHAGRDRVVSG